MDEQQASRNFMRPSETKSETKSIFRSVIDDRVYIAHGNVEEMMTGRSIRLFRTDHVLKYHALCDDFGPMNLSCVARFVELLDSELAEYPSHAIVYFVSGGRRAVTNALFLLGCYMILRFKATWKQLAYHFRWVDLSVAEPFRDATFAKPNFTLTLMDCWMGLQKGIDSKWLSLPTLSSPEQWGSMNIHEYEHYDHPNNGHLHEVVPGKLLAFPGPVDIGARECLDDPDGFRQMSPKYYLRVFREIGVKAVIRLNEPEYDERVFSNHGIRHFDLFFDDCTTPPSHVVNSFLKIVDTCTDGLVAVHCKAGLGRTGTLMALYLMRSHGFRAKEAIGWMRIVRPGCVIGEQQQYLVDAERQGTADSEQGALEPHSPSESASRRQPGKKVVTFCDRELASERPASLAGQVAEGVRRQCILQRAASA